MAAPSLTDVPLPSSSMITNEVGPTLDKMNWVSCISTMNVEELVSMQSLLETLEKMRSGMRNKADSAGTLLPT